MSLASGALALAAAVGADVKALDDALTGKQATLISGTNIKTVNGGSILGTGDITLVTQAEFDAALGDISAALTTINGA